VITNVEHVYLAGTSSGKGKPCQTMFLRFSDVGGPITILSTDI